jgi:hypothetical protein
MFLTRRLFTILLLLVLCSSGAFLLTNCGGIGECTGGAPVPRLSSVTPNAVDMNALPSTITVSGNKFVSWSVVNLNGSPLRTTFVSGSRLTATVPVEMLAWSNINTGSTVQISVTTAGTAAGGFGGITGCTDGGTSGSAVLTFH